MHGCGGESRGAGLCKDYRAVLNSPLHCTRALGSNGRIFQLHVASGFKLQNLNVVRVFGVVCFRNLNLLHITTWKLKCLGGRSW